MALLNKAVNEITLKLVYYGPGLCGKTTNLERVHADPRLPNKGRLLSMSTETDRTLFFDFMPMELGTVRGQKIRVQLYTVPGQVFYNATRKLVLRGADGVVFVADSQPNMRESNVESFHNLIENLRINRLNPARVPIVFQYNKRDLPSVDPVEAMNEYLQPGGAPVLEAAAIEGRGVRETLQKAIGLVLQNIRDGVDLTLAVDDAPQDSEGEPAEPERVASVFSGARDVQEPVAGKADAQDPVFEELLERSREVIRSLESALEAARAHERRILEQLGRH